MNSTAVEVPHSLALLRTRARIFDHIYDGVIVTTPDGVITDWNVGAERMFGWSREEVIGQSPSILHRPADAPVLTDAINAAAIQYGRWVGEITFVRKDGTTGVCETVTMPLFDDEGRVTMTVGVNREITTRKQAEDRLASERLLLRTLIDAIPDPIFFKDRDGRHLIMNVANRSLFGFNDEEHTGKTVFELPLAREHAALYAADDEAVMSSGLPIINREEPYIASDGRRGWFLTSKFPLRNGRGEITGLIGIAHDITAMKEAAEEMARMRQRMIDHVDNSPLAVVEWSPECRIERWAGQAETIFGWTTAEVLGKTPDELGLVHPDDRTAVEDVTRDLLDGRVHHNVSRNRNFTKSGRVLHVVWNNSILRDAEGRPLSILSLAADVTQRVLAEEVAREAEAARAELERKLLEAQKRESLGVLAGGIAHDFNNLLTGILGHASMLADGLTVAPSLREHAQQIETIATRAADMCKQMLAYSGRGRFVLQRLDLGAVVQETAKLLQFSISKKSVMRFQFARPLPAVMADPTQLRQIIMNLVINAAEAIGDRHGSITVSTSAVQAESAFFQEAVLTPDLPAGEYVCLEIADSGTGMSAEVKARIFDPFFTTKFTGRGLGLAAVLGIVQGHGGALMVESEEGAGTKFRVLFPGVEGEPDAGIAVEEVSPTVPWKRGSRVLVVDDEPIVQRITAEILRALDFDVTLANDGREAVSRFQEVSGQFLFIVLDLTMPGMDGEETFHALRRLDPEVRVLMMSGFDEVETTARFTGLGLAGFIQKPFKLATMREKLREILAAPL